MEIVEVEPADDRLDEIYPVLGELRTEQGCELVTLDSHANRDLAHRFYFREGYVITSFHFGQPLR